MKNELLRIENLSVVSETKNRLNNIWFDVFAGETVGLLELYASEASLLIDTICGLEPSYSGNIIMSGKIERIQGDIQSRKLGIYRINAFSKLIQMISISENIFIIREGGLKHFFVNKKIIDEQARALLWDIGVDIDINTKIPKLTAAQKHYVELAKAIGLGCKLIIYDRAFNNYTPQDLIQQQRIMDRLKERGISFLINCNYVEELRLLADKIIFFRDGKISKKLDSPVIEDQTIKSYLTGEVSNIDKTKPVRSVNSDFFSVRNFELSKNSKLEFVMGKGEILSIVCSEQNIRETIFNVLSGGIISTTIEIKLEANYFRSIKDELDLYAFKIVNIRNLWGEEELFHNLSTSENALFPSLKKASGPFGFVSKDIYKLINHELSDKLEHKKIDEMDVAGKISLLFERWFIYNPKVLVIYEPFLYSDVITEDIIRNNLEKLCNNGTAIILISARKQKVSEICHQFIEI